MSKPDKPGELQNVKVKAISLVSKAANQQKFKILKSADTVPDEQITTKDERGLFHILKNYTYYYIGDNNFRHRFIFRTCS